MLVTAVHTAERRSKNADVAVFTGRFQCVKIVLVHILRCQNSKPDLNINPVQFYGRTFGITACFGPLKMRDMPASTAS